MNHFHDWGYLLAAFAGLTMATVVTRGSFFMLPARYALPAQIERALRYAPACALTAIVHAFAVAPTVTRLLPKRRLGLCVVLAQVRKC